MNYQVIGKGKYFLLIERLQDLSSDHKNIYLFDALKHMCPNEKCNVSSGANYFYQDNAHISNYAAKYILAPEMLKFIDKEKIIESSENNMD